MNLQCFDFESQAVRVLDRDGEPWFVASDVCRALDLVNSRKAVAALDGDEKDVTIGDTPGGAQKLQVINESGLYALIFKSRKPAAKRFRKWVTGEVLPAIRKTGRYALGPDGGDEAEARWMDGEGRELMTVPDFLDAVCRELGRKLPHGVAVATGLEASRLARAYRVRIPHREHGTWGPQVGLFAVEMLRQAWARKGRPALEAYDLRLRQREFGFAGELAA